MLNFWKILLLSYCQWWQPNAPFKERVLWKQVEYLKKDSGETLFESITGLPALAVSSPVSIIVTSCALNIATIPPSRETLHDISSYGHRILFWEFWFTPSLSQRYGIQGINKNCQPYKYVTIGSTSLRGRNGKHIHEIKINQDSAKEHLVRAVFKYAVAEIKSLWYLNLIGHILRDDTPVSFWNVNIYNASEFFGNI